MPNKRGDNFKNRKALRAKEEEYKSRKPEIINTFLKEGSSGYRASKVLKIPQSSLRQLLIRWKDDIERFKIVYIPGEMVSLNKHHNKIQATVIFEYEELKRLRLGMIELRFISQEINQGRSEEPGPV